MQSLFISLCLIQLGFGLRSIAIELLLLPADFSELQLNLCSALAVLLFCLGELHLLDFKPVGFLNSMLSIDSRLLCGLMGSLVVGGTLIEFTLQLALN